MRATCRPPSNGVASHTADDRERLGFRAGALAERQHVRVVVRSGSRRPPVRSSRRRTGCRRCGWPPSLRRCRIRRGRCPARTRRAPPPRRPGGRSRGNRRTPRMRSRSPARVAGGRQHGLDRFLIRKPGVVRAIASFIVKTPGVILSPLPQNHIRCLITVPMRNTAKFLLAGAFALAMGPGAARAAAGATAAAATAGAASRSAAGLPRAAELVTTDVIVRDSKDRSVHGGPEADRLRRHGRTA